MLKKRKGKVNPMYGNDMLNFVANCAAGLETLVYDEVISFGGKQVNKNPGIVSWKGSLETAYRTCLWTRFASKVLLKIESAQITDADDLYNKCKKINWRRHLNSTMTFSISSTLGDNPAINHSHFAALRIKDGIVDSFREMGLTRPNVAKEHPDCKFHFHLHKEEASLYVDLSGDSLHKRGYREATGIAPLKETLAAAIVSLVGWDRSVSPKMTFLDPMCGSGTLLIEAALIWGDSAPGLSRKYYGFNRWLGHDESLWSDIVEEAVEREGLGLEKKWPRIIGYDSEPEMIAAARRNIEKAGLEDKIEVKCKDIAYLQPPSLEGFFVSNLPYGERLSEKNHVKFLYSCVGRILSKAFGQWKAGLLISEPDLADKLNLLESKRYRLYNGPISCRLFVGNVKESNTTKYLWTTKRDLQLQEGVDFANRLIKNYKKLKPWAAKNNISCYRIYDRDLPEYNVAIDIYDRWILVQEFVPSSSIDNELRKKRLSLILYCVREVFQTRKDKVFIKQRKRQRGKEQYQKKDIRPKMYEVSEGDCFFLVNFTNYIDTGLFLDHRPMRLKIAELAQGKRFLNLFGYTGAATVHAAKGGALSSVTVDLSSTYLEWTKKNLDLNGLSHSKHKVFRQDCMSWLKEAQGRYDIIFIDPPTFSNTKKKSFLFDIQKNHVELLTLAANLLEAGGIIYFSTNYRGFKLDANIGKRFHVKNISSKTIPFDFQRNKAIHKCWEITN